MPKKKRRSLQYKLAQQEMKIEREEKKIEKEERVIEKAAKTVKKEEKKVEALEKKILLKIGRLKITKKHVFDFAKITAGALLGTSFG